MREPQARSGEGQDRQVDQTERIKACTALVSRSTKEDGRECRECEVMEVCTQYIRGRVEAKVVTMSSIVPSIEKSSRAEIVHMKLQVLLPLDHYYYTCSAFTMESTDLTPMLEDLSDHIDDLEEALKPLLSSTLPDISSRLPLLDKAKLHVFTASAIESLLFCTSRHSVSQCTHPCAY
jgi:hypothetical protein